MPATAGRVRMPANNRVHSSAALQTHGIWQSAIGYDPYAPDQTAAGDRDGAAARSAGAPSADQQNAYDSFQGLLALARLTGSNADEARGSCPKCGRVGHLPFQCRNFLVLKDKPTLAAAATSSLTGFADIDGGGAVHRKGRERRRREEGSGRGDDGGKAGSDTSCEDQSSDDEESDLTDSSEDSEMERAIVAKYGKNVLKSSSHRSKSGHKKERSEATRHRRSHSKRSKSKKDASDDDAISSEEQKKKARHRSKPKRSRKDALESGSDEDSSGSDGEAKRRTKRRGHSHKHGKSKSKKKHRDEQSNESSDGGDAKHAKKSRHVGQHRDRKHS